MHRRGLALALWFSAVTLISAFLVFQVQPVISKTVLPWFGGSPAVWTTCMLFFQVVLFAGYAYAHVLNRFRPRHQGLIHLALLIVTLFTLPITPSDGWKPSGDENPTWQILLILGANVGLPYFLLSSTGPLLQAWYSRACPSHSPYRLYALSNIGSLAALLSYPLLFETAFDTTFQGIFWSIGYSVFALLCGYLAGGLGRLSNSTEISEGEASNQSSVDLPPSLGRRLAWLLLPALGSVLLLATTSHVCQDVAVIPFLWVAPLALYLLTFIICFDREAWYSRRIFASLVVISVAGLTIVFSLSRVIPIVPEVLIYFVTLFLGCMVCHGELVRSKPKPAYLTTFYLMSSGGGAIGGIIVALLCPLMFTTYFELNLSLIALLTLSMGLLCYEMRDGFLVRPQRRFVAALFFFGMFVVIGALQSDQAKGSAVVAKRNFYGALKVEMATTKEGVGLSLTHGRIIHGFQFADTNRLRFPTTYYARQSGVGLTLENLRQADQPLRVGAVGLGVGTVSAYARQGDYYRFYEINPAMVDVAKNTFGFLSTCPAQVDIEMGDARLSMEQDPPQNFDALVLDAFSGDSIPTHLLTAEAFAIYRKHLRPHGVIAVHISNRHLRLEAVVLRQAEHAGMKCVRVVNQGNTQQAVMLSKWMLVTNNESFLACPEVEKMAGTYTKVPGATFPLWTDRYNNLFQILNVY